MKNKLKDIKRNQHKHTSGSHTNRGTFVPPIDARFGKGTKPGNLKKLKNSDIFREVDEDSSQRMPLALGGPLSSRRPEDINVLLNSKSNSLELEKDLNQDQYHLSYRNNGNLLQNRSEVNPQKGQQFGILKNNNQSKGEQMSSMRIQDEGSHVPPQLTEELPSTVDQPTSENHIEKAEQIAESLKSHENGVEPGEDSKDENQEAGSNLGQTYGQQTTGSAEYLQMNQDCFNIEQDFYYDSSVEPRLASKKLSHRTGKPKMFSSFAV